MKRRNHTEDREVEDPRVDAFLAEIVDVCRKHGMSIDHEDTHGNFIVRLGTHQSLFDWLMSAPIGGPPL